MQLTADSRQGVRPYHANPGGAAVDGRGIGDGGGPGVVPRYVPAINKNELQEHLLFRLEATFLASK